MICDAALMPALYHRDVPSNRLVFGLVASSAPAAAPFGPLGEWLAKHSGVEVTQRIAANYKDLMASVREGTTDIAWLPPVVYAWLAEAVNPVGSIVRKGRTSYSAALVTQEGSKVAKLGELGGTLAGWVDPFSAAGYVVPRIELARTGVDPRETFAREMFYGTHRDAVDALAKGTVDIIGTFEDAWTLVPDFKVRVLATWGPIPTDVIATRRNLLPADYELVLETLRAACKDDEARPLISAVFGGDELREGIEPGHDKLRLAYESAVAAGLFD